MLGTMRCFYSRNCSILRGGLKNAIPFFQTLLIVFITIFSFSSVSAQVANDDCTGAIFMRLERGVPFCGEYTSLGAQPSGLASPGCFQNNISGNDVWFTFVAVGTEVNISVFGHTMTRPEIALYSGTCNQFSSSFSELRCFSSLTGNLEISRGALTVGETYFIRVQGANNTRGTFRLCVSNYNPPAVLDADCPKGAVLCDKSSFSVKNLIGGGNDQTELNDASCLAGGGEQASTWFRWTAATSGSLTFKITPFFLGDSLQEPLGDDIDFALYELPNGINTCQGKTLVRCMAAGPYSDPRTGTTIKDALRCMGATGLKDGATDVSEEGGCDRSVAHDNFLRSLDMVAGKSYALGINNFSTTGNGFTIEFGGSGTFVGPEAKIGINKADKQYCLGEDVIFTDASSFALGQITKKQWRFGSAASIDSASGNGPFRVFYKTPGWKSVVLTVTTDRGCTVTSILDSIYVKPFQYDSVVRKPTCVLGKDGMIRLTVKDCGRAPIRYNWENTGYTTRDSITGLSAGRYKVAVTDSSGVYVDTITFYLKQFEVELDTAKRIITPPRCFGQTNAKIELNPKTGEAPFRYRWNNNTSFTADNTLTAIGEGQYTVEIRDKNECKGFYSFDVIAPPPVAVNVDTFNISCYGKTDGIAIAYPSGGVGKYSVSWSRGDLGDTIRNLRAGTYTVYVVDSNQCSATSGVRVTEPTEIKLNLLRLQGAKCYGDSTAELVIEGRGGTPPYRYSIDGIRFQRDTSFLKIPAKKYNVVVRDSTGCRTTIQVDVPQPPQLQVSVGPDIDVELGFAGNVRATVVPSTQLVSYNWTPNDTTITCATCASTTIFPLRNTIYKVIVKDSMGCTAFDDLLVQVIKKRPIFIPNVFSPIDHNGVNDYFTVYGNQSAVIIKELKVFNRWGDLIFQTANIPLNKDEAGWDGTWQGKRLEPDVFVFFAVVKFIDGEEVLYKGDVSIVR